MSIKLEFLMEAVVEIGEPLVVGETARGFRRVIPITGGTFEGPRLKGKIIPGGADWQVIRPDGVTELEARYTVQTEDGELISIVNKGLRHGPEEVMQKLLQGLYVDPDEYYFKTVPVFEVSGDRYAWLNRKIFVGRGIRNPSTVHIEIFEVV
ncbi:DUF3237 domain-containing protein [Ammoniphilus sp. 3BR4]|uniref:DUF3237 domain-containing protein n=1 Tax=Ammoniphilus sp. 3BR4 TaxID=3158265 RepID=UPI003465A2C0